MRINLEIPDNLNVERKKLDATWRDVIVAGITYLGKPPRKTDPAIEENLKLAVKHMSEAWNIIKKTR